MREDNGAVQEKQCEKAIKQTVTHEANQPWFNHYTTQQGHRWHEQQAQQPPGNIFQVVLRSDTFPCIIIWVCHHIGLVKGGAAAGGVAQWYLYPTEQSTELSVRSQWAQVSPRCTRTHLGAASRAVLQGPSLQQTCKIRHLQAELQQNEELHIFRDQVMWTLWSSRASSP